MSDTLSLEHKVLPPDRSPARQESTLPPRLTTAIAALAAAAAGAGLVIDDLYREPAGLREMYRGYDLVTVVVVVPTLLASVRAARLGSTRARLVWLGALGFMIYNYALYVFGAAFNDVFLVHVAIFLLAMVTLGVELARTNAQQVASEFSARAPARTVAGILTFLAAGLGAMWAFNALRFAVTGETPAESELIVPIATTHLGYALDLTLLVPSYATAAVLLWRRRAWGFLFAPVLLVAGVGQQLSYMTALVFQSRADLPGATAFDPGEPLIVAAYLLGAVLLLRQARPHRPWPRASRLSSEPRSSA